MANTIMSDHTSWLPTFKILTLWFTFTFFVSAEILVTVRNIAEFEKIYIGSPMVCDVIWFLSNELRDFYPRAFAKSHNELDKNHITSQNMGDSFYHIFTTNIPILYTLFFGLRGVGIHNVISKIYHMSVITLISRKICDKKGYIVGWEKLRFFWGISNLK
jgi:hypothetical protein